MDSERNNTTNKQSIEASTARVRMDDRKRRSKVTSIASPKRERGTRKTSELATELNSLADDVFTIAKSEDKLITSGTITSDAKNIPLPRRTHEISEKAFSSQSQKNVFVESRFGFQTKTANQLQKTYPENTSIHIDQQLTQDIQYGLQFILQTHLSFQALGFAVLGLLAGGSLVHTLFVRSFLTTQTVSLDDGPVQGQWNDGQLLVQRYGMYAKPVSTAYYICLVLSGLFTLGRSDMGHLTWSCMTRSMKFANSGISVLFITIAFMINNAMFWYDCTLDLLAHKQPNEILSILSVDALMNQQIRTWLTLDICRTIFVVAAWLAISLASGDVDRLVLTLKKDPYPLDGDSHG